MNEHATIGPAVTRLARRCIRAAPWLAMAAAAHVLSISVLASAQPERRDEARAARWPAANLAFKMDPPREAHVLEEEARVFVEERDGVPWSTTGCGSWIEGPIPTPRDVELRLSESTAACGPPDGRSGSGAVMPGPPDGVTQTLRQDDSGAMVVVTCAYRDRRALKPGEVRSPAEADPDPVLQALRRERSLRVETRRVFVPLE